MKTRASRDESRRLKEIGWRELVGLPDLGISEMRAKIDSGARTSALHAVDLEPFEENGAHWIAFHVPTSGYPRATRCAAHIVDERLIKNTSGVPEYRYVVETTLVLGRRHWRIEVSLADRENMGLDLILGRTAVRGHRLLINPGRSFLAGHPAALASHAHAAPEDGLMRTLKRGEVPPNAASKEGDTR